MLTSSYDAFEVGGSADGFLFRSRNDGDGNKPSYSLDVWSGGSDQEETLVPALTSEIEDTETEGISKELNRVLGFSDSFYRV